MRRRTYVVAAGATLLALVWVATGSTGERLPVAEPIVVRTALVDASETLQRNETLSELFARQGVAGAELLRLVTALRAEGINPRRVNAGAVYEFRRAVDEPLPRKVRTRVGDERVVVLTRDGTRGWNHASTPIVWTSTPHVVAGTILSSLYETIDALVPDSVLPAVERPRLVWDLADGVFGWTIDFTRDNYQGDRVEILFERVVSGLGDVRFGRVVAAKIETRGAENTAYVMTAADGRNEYFDADGQSLKRAFKRYPTEFRRISSGFSRQRFHPILKTNRAHLGVDYAAARGTPIIATADGTVMRAGRWGGYGIIVTVRHPKGFETRYAHMQNVARGIRAGVRVTQGQVIGYVGMTGLATAPHLHYEFLHNGRHVNPNEALRFGAGDPISESRRTEFNVARAAFDRMLATFPRPRTVASAD
jgi:murein DD-endopeptidase MepM/ murein hydrolase activator NlpD